jgi:aminopeptidase N
MLKQVQHDSMSLLFLLTFKEIFSYFMRLLFLIFISLLSLQGFTQIDVKHYRFNIQLSDETDKINAKATIAISFPIATKEFSLDLIQTKGNKGMKVEGVKGANVASFQQSNDKLNISLKHASTKTTDTFDITYSGIPDDGLIISKNRFGDRTFFSDNWPNRAHNWIPCNDILTDKASVEFIVTAPSHYQIISNGIQIEETNLDKNKKLTHWKENVPISTKIMVIGAAPFAAVDLGDYNNIAVSAWVYPQNKDKGVYDYSVALPILKFFTEYIAPFPFEKLANVQSTTIFGGMENASAIFYDERAVNGRRTSEPTVAHEIAHQWFGDMASEKSFEHLWLSEGFATYLTNIYWEQQYGKEKMWERLEEDRQKVISFSRINKRSVVDSISDYMDLLNANSYQKGGWILHMLRNEIGDAVFQKIIQQYYQQYKGSNADTRDFQSVAEKVSGKKLDWFFNQWLYQSGIPQVDLEWSYDSKEKKADFVLKTNKNTRFNYNLDIAVEYKDGKREVIKNLFEVEANSALLTKKISVRDAPVKITIDPSMKLLYSGTVSKK